MLDLFSGTHILILLAIALVVVGPKDLPRMMHLAGRWMGKARAMANEFRKSFDEMARQGELDELRAEIEALRKNNPLADMQRAMDEPIIPADMQSYSGADRSAPAPEPHAPEPREGELHVTDEAQHDKIEPPLP